MNIHCRCPFSTIVAGIKLQLTITKLSHVTSYLECVWVNVIPHCVCMHMWQSRVEIEGYSVVYFECIAVLEVPYHWTSVKRGADTCNVDVWIYKVHMSPALDNSSAIQCFEGSDAIEIRDGITFDFYTRLPQMWFSCNNCDPIYYGSNMCVNTYKFLTNRFGTSHKPDQNLILANLTICIIAATTATTYDLIAIIITYVQV